MKIARLIAAMFAAAACGIANAICSRTIEITPALVACLERIGSTAGVPQPQWAYAAAVSTWGIVVLVLVVILGIVGVIADRWPYTLVNYALLLLAATYFALAFIACRAVGESAVSCNQKLSPTAILLFNGDGTSPNDVAAIERILKDNNFNYSTANSKRLNGMSESQLGAYRLLIVPGGNFEEIGNGLTSRTTASIRNAVRGGLNYLGICAGAFFAGSSPYNGLDLTSGVRFGFYAIEGRGVRKAAVDIAIAGSPARSHYWEDGPQLTGWGDVVARYPDGTPAIVEGNVDKGLMILTGIHAEAPESWRRGLTFTTPASVDNAYAAILIGAALNRTPLQHY